MIGDNSSLANSVPLDIWRDIIARADLSEKNAVLLSKTRHRAVDEKYVKLNRRENYLAWDKDHLKTDLSERLTYFSNKKFHELLGRGRKHFIQPGDLPKVYNLIKKDTCFLEENHIFKLVAEALFSNGTSTFKCDYEADNQQYVILNNFLSNLLPNTFSSKEINLYEKANHSFCNLLKNNEEVIRLRNLKNPTLAERELIIQLDEYSSFADVVKLFMKYSNEQKFKFLENIPAHFDKLEVLKSSVKYFRSENPFDAERKKNLLFLIAQKSGKLEDLVSFFEAIQLDAESFVYKKTDCEVLYNNCIRYMKEESNDPRLANVLRNVSKILSAAGYFKKAIDCLEWLVASDQEARKYEDLSNLAIQYQEIKKFEEAILCWDKVFKATQDISLREKAMISYEELGKAQEFVNLCHTVFDLYTFIRPNELKFVADFCARAGLYEEELLFRERMVKAQVVLDRDMEEGFTETIVEEPKEKTNKKCIIM